MMRISRHVAAIMALLTGTGVAEIAHGAPADAISKCHAIVDNSARLSCYGTTVGSFEAAVAKHDVVIMDRNTMRQTRRGLFGFTLPKTPLFVGDNVRDNVSEIDTAVSSATLLGNGKWRMRMDDGALWETTESIGWNAPKTGSKIHLKAGAFGSYFITIDRDNPIRGMRVG